MLKPLRLLKALLLISLKMVSENMALGLMSSFGQGIKNLPSTFLAQFSFPWLCWLQGKRILLFGGGGWKEGGYQGWFLGSGSKESKDLNHKRAGAISRTWARGRGVENTRSYRPSLLGSVKEIWDYWAWDRRTGLILMPNPVLPPPPPLQGFTFPLTGGQYKLHSIWMTQKELDSWGLSQPHSKWNA